MDYNDLYTEGTFLGTWDNRNATDLAAWRALSGQDSHSVSVDPRFVSGTDLHAQSPALADAGVAVSEVSTDIDGEARDATPSIGADEFSAAGLTPLAGTYTIGRNGADFASFNAAVDALRIHGISGAVVFEVMTDTYHEQVVIPAVYGRSATNTVTFRSATGDAADVIVTYAATSADSNYVIQLNNASNVRLRNLTVAATGSSSTRAISVINRVEDLVIENNRLSAPVPSPSGDANDYDGTQSVLHLAPALVSDIRIRNNRVTGGSYGVFFASPGRVPATGTEITGNVVEAFSKYGVSLRDLQGGTFTGNRITALPTSSENYGLYVSSWTGTEDSPILVANNFVSLPNGAEAVYLSNANYLQFSFNSVYAGGAGKALLILNASDAGVKNNIFRAETGYAARVYYAFGLDMDYNDLFTTGPYLASWDNTNVTDLAAWQMTSGQGRHSISVDPQFVSATDLHARNPALSRAGVKVAAVPRDIDGEDRRDPPSIGADEFSTESATDQDGDGIDDGVDNCPAVFNPAQADRNGNGIGDACEMPELDTLSAFWLEAECGEVGRNWVVAADADASNTAFVYAPDRRYVTSPPPSVPENRIRFRIDQAAPGAYFLHIRAFTRNTSEDSFWVRANGGAWIQWNNIYRNRTFDWATLPATLELTAGANTLDIAFREGGARLDKLFLGRDAAPPTGFGEPATNCSGLAPQPPTAIASASVSRGVAPLTVQLDGSQSYDYDGQIARYDWIWRGGSATGPTPTATFAAGNYTVELKVTDLTGDTNTTTLDLRVYAPDELTSAPPFSFEAECSVRGRGWSVGENWTASGNRFVTHAECQCLEEPTPERAYQQLNIDFLTTRADSFYLYVRLQTLGVGNNSFWVRVDGGDWIKMWREADGRELLTQGFEWRRVNDDTRPVSFYLTPGNHTITVAPREPGTELDKLILSPSDAPPPRHRRTRPELYGLLRHHQDRISRNGRVHSPERRIQPRGISQSRHEPPDGGTERRLYRRGCPYRTGCPRAPGTLPALPQGGKHLTHRTLGGGPARRRLPPAPAGRKLPTGRALREGIVAPAAP